LIEAAAEGEDSLLEKYLESGELTDEEVLRGLRKVILDGTFIPVLASAAGNERVCVSVGRDRRLDALSCSGSRCGRSR